MQGNLAATYERLGRLAESLRNFREIYARRLNLNGEQHIDTLRAAFNYASSFLKLRHFEEAKSLMRKTMPVARRVLGENNTLFLCMREVYAHALFHDMNATLDDLCEAVTMCEDTVRIARRVLGPAHPFTKGTDTSLRKAQAVLRARKTPSRRA